MRERVGNGRESVCEREYVVGEGVGEGESVDIKSVLPLVTTLSNIISLPSSSLCIIHTKQSQYLSGDKRIMKTCSVYHVAQCSLSTVRHAVSTESHRLYRVQFRMQYSLSHHLECSIRQAIVQNVVITEQQFRAVSTE